MRPRTRELGYKRPDEYKLLIQSTGLGHILHKAPDMDRCNGILERIRIEESQPLTSGQYRLIEVGGRPITGATDCFHDRCKCERRHIIIRRKALKELPSLS
ncbi:hypothetical protein EYR41_007690 [Orbilia oligospora]|uniref:Uncharacterized protein n=1 Tax=Orbilia oligospora TaxID=2813651 RepID=A0A7C8KDS0_ORBOL|nr:hypothetical protein TWF751_007070 [Orbilia oligospora]TGJ66030.1 hypothetical protein EYR41_007690 [Orbilia oligospora]